jgi:DNA mismatch repair protein MutS
MEIDHTTLTDLSVLNADEDFSVFSKLNFCRTAGGRHRLFYNFSTPLKTIEQIQGIQDTIRFILQKEQHWLGADDRKILQRHDYRYPRKAIAGGRAHV